MREQLAWAIGKPEAEQLLSDAQMKTEAYYGRLVQARKVLQRSVESSRLAVNHEQVADSQAAEALLEAEIGNPGRARKVAGEALQLALERAGRANVALALARTGELSQAQKLVEELNREFPLDTMTQYSLLPTIRAAIELQKKNPAKAIELLQAVAPYELGNSDLATLYPAYVRGQAYLDSGKPVEAVTEFQKILDHPGMVRIAVIGALAHLQLGRAQTMMGDKAAARKAYQDFLSLWKEADPDIPIYKQAEAEYSKLQ